MANSKLIVLVLVALALTSQAKFGNIRMVRDLKGLFQQDSDGDNDGTTTTTNSTNSNITIPTKTLNATVVAYYFSAIAGALQGFEQGLYANKNIAIPTSCLDQATLNTFLSLYKVTSAKTAFKLPTEASLIFQLAYLLNTNCLTNELTNDLFIHTFSGAVTPEELFTNTQSNLFKLTGAINEIFSMFFNEESTPTDEADLQSCFNYYEGFG